MSESRLGNDRVVSPPGSRRWLLLAPAILLLATVYLIPLAWLVRLSLVGAAHPFEHYWSLARDTVFLRVFVNTFLMAGTVTAACLVLGYPVAYMLSSVGRRTRVVLMALVIVPYFTSVLVRTYAWMVLLGRNGLVNQFLQALGVVETPLAILYTRLGSYIGMVHIMVPIMVLAVYSSMVSIDPGLMRAARSLGVGRLQAFWQVYFPLSLPGILAGSLLVFIFSLGFFITPALLGGARDLVISVLIQIEVNELLRWSVAAAASVMLLVVTLALLIGARYLGFGTGLLEGGSRAGPVAAHGWNMSTYVRVVGIACAKVLRASGELRAGLRRAGGLLARARMASDVHGAGMGVRCFGVLLVMGLVLPSVIVVAISFSSGSFLMFPPPGLSLRWYHAYFADEVWIASTVFSAEVALLTTAVSMVIGTLAALALHRDAGRLARAIFGLVLAPLITPSIVLAVGLYYLYSRVGLTGSLAGFVGAHSVGAVALVVVIVTAALRGFDPTLEKAASSLGASPARVFWRVTLPSIRPGLLSAALLAFLHSFDEVVISIFISGIGGTTLPPKMWEDLRNQIDPRIAAVSTLLIVLTLVVALGVQLRPPRKAA